MAYSGEHKWAGQGQAFFQAGPASGTMLVTEKKNSLDEARTFATLAHPEGGSGRAPRTSQRRSGMLIREEIMASTRFKAHGFEVRGRWVSSCMEVHLGRPGGWRRSRSRSGSPKPSPSTTA